MNMPVLFFHKFFLNSHAMSQVPSLFGFGFSFIYIFGLHAKKSKKNCRKNKLHMFKFFIELCYYVKLIIKKTIFKRIIIHNGISRRFIKVYFMVFLNSCVKFNYGFCRDYFIFKVDTLFFRLWYYFIYLFFQLTSSEIVSSSNISRILLITPSYKLISLT